MRARIGAGAGATVVVALVLLAQCGLTGSGGSLRPSGSAGPGGPTLRVPPGGSRGSAGGALSDTVPNRPYYWQVGLVCVQGGKRVRIASAQLVHPTGGERLTDVAVRPSLWVSRHRWRASKGHVPRRFYMSGRGPISTFGFHDKVVDQPCFPAQSDRSPYEQVAIQVERADTHPSVVAHADAVRILYGNRQSLLLKFEPVLCPPKGGTKKWCN